MNLRTRDITVMTSKEVLPDFLIFINHGQLLVRLIEVRLESGALFHVKTSEIHQKFRRGGRLIGGV